MLTYIITTKSGQYCGRTNNISQRLSKHLKEKYPHWFCSKDRKRWTKIVLIENNFERKIKNFGVEDFLSIKEHVFSPVNE